MSWFFGKKKHHKDSPPDSPEEEVPPEQGEDFIFIERRNPGANTGDNGARSSGLYPSISGLPYYPPMPQTNNLQQNPQVDSQSYLNSIPFKYGKDLEKSLHSDMDIDRLRVNEIMSFIERVQKENTEYSFSIEKSVIAEMDCVNNWYKLTDDSEQTENNDRILCTLFTITIIVVITVIIVLVIVNQNASFFTEFHLQWSFPAQVLGVDSSLQH